MNALWELRKTVIVYMMHEMGRRPLHVFELKNYTGSALSMRFFLFLFSAGFGI